MAETRAIAALSSEEHVGEIEIDNEQVNKAGSDAAEQDYYEMRMEKQAIRHDN